MSYDLCFQEAGRMNPSEAKALFKTLFKHIQSYDAVLRELENVDMLFELTMSASCFAQLKRHRIATLISQDYSPSLGVTLPPAVRAIGRQKEFMAMIKKTNSAYEIIRHKSPAAAPYVLTNAHRRRVLMKLNARELYHLARLRTDRHAQWDIRNLSERMLKQARNIMPLTLMMACGKDGFDARRKIFFPKA